MTKEAKNIMVGILGAVGVIQAVGLAVGGGILAVTHYKSKKAKKEYDRWTKEYESKYKY